MTTTNMKAMVATGYGSPEVLQLQQISRPKPKSNEILVQVKTAAATRADTMMRTGKPYFARLFLGLTKPGKPVPGTGFAGIVAEVGDQVTQYNVGDRVFGETGFRFSACAEYLTIAENGIVLPMPDHMDYTEAASFGDGHLTSFNFLKEIAGIQPGQKILINGASGALGTSAVQIAKYLGAAVTAVCSGRNIGLVTSLGADRVIDYQKEDFTLLDHSFDLVYDTVGLSDFSQCKNILTPQGKYLSPVLNLNLLWDMLRTARSRKQKAIFQATGTLSEDKLQAMLREVVAIYNTGKLKTFIDRQYPLEKLAEAHRYIDAGHKKGNIVIVNS